MSDPLQNTITTEVRAIIQSVDVLEFVFPSMDFV